ncbi:MAG TPA: retropepsin-like aspartic protease [Candidatus Angelobacter sp.]
MQTSQETCVTFRLTGDKRPLILLPVFVDGRGPFSFVLDTGAGPTLISNELADALALPRGEEQDGQGAVGKMILVKSELPSLTVGQETLESIPVSVTDLSFIGRADGARVDGNLGHSFLRHFAMTLDYATNALTLRRPIGGAERALGESEIAFQSPHADNTLVVVPVFVNDKGPYDFVLDTGASRTAISLKMAAEFGLAAEKIIPLTGGGGSVNASQVRLSSLRVGAARQENLAAAASDFLTQLNATLGTTLQGIVGYNFLRHYRVTLDYPRATLNLE